jgi:hypothetical protein
MRSKSNEMGLLKEIDHLLLFKLFLKQAIIDIIEWK